MKRFAVIGLFTTLLLAGFSGVANAAAAVYTVVVEKDEVILEPFSGTYPAGYSIWNKGTITIGTTDVVTYFRNNTTNKTDGGAIYNTSIINSITNTIFQENHAQYGGAVWSNKTVAVGGIQGSQFIRNTARSKGGAIYAAGALGTISNSIFTQNSVVGDTSSKAGFGGAICAVNDLTIINSTFTGNTAYRNGGAIAMMGGDLSIIAREGGTTTFSENRKAFGTVSETPNDIYMGDTKQTLRLIANGTNSTVKLGGGVDFAKDLQLVINESNTDPGKVIIGGNVGASNKRASMTIYGGEFSLVSDNVFNTVYAGSVDVASDTHLFFDVSLASDKFNYDQFNLTSATGKGKLIITADSFNITSGFITEKDSQTVDLVKSSSTLSEVLRFLDDDGNPTSIVYKYDEDGEPEYKIRQTVAGTYIISNPKYIDYVTNPLAYAVNYSGTPTGTIKNRDSQLDLLGNTCNLTLKKNISINSWEDLPVDNPETGKKELKPRNIQQPDYLSINGKGKVITAQDNLVGMASQEGKTLGITNVTFTGFKQAVANGQVDAEGNITTTGGTVSITSTGFKKNYDETEGGKGAAISNYDGQMYITGTSKKNKAIFQNNTADNGGAVYNKGYLNIMYGTFGANATTKKKKTTTYSNTAKNGGALFNSQQDVNVLGTEKPNLEILGSTFIHNIADENGGALFNEYADGATNQSASVNAVFTRNIAGNYGGAIYNSGNLTALSSTFGKKGKTAEANTAVNGGAIYNAGEGLLTSITSSFYSNKATENGGAIYNADNATAVLSGGTFASNSAILGGAIYNEKDAVLSLDANITTKYVYLGFSGNTAEYGGAIYNLGEIKPTNISDIGLPVNIMGTFSKNKAVVAAQTYQGIDITKVDDPTLYKAPKGGAIYSEGSLDIINGSFTSNSVSTKVVITTNQYHPIATDPLRMATDNITKYVGQGGAIYTNTSEDFIDGGEVPDIYITKTTFNKNSAAQAGGAIRNENADSTIYITDSDFVSNSAKTTITTVTTTMLINGATVKNKKSTKKETIGYGGAISTKGNVEINTGERYQVLVNQTNFKSNTAGYGGAIYADGKVNGTKTAFTSNSAAHEGGAIKTPDNVIFEDSTFSSNSAAEDGGAINAKNVVLTNSREDKGVNVSFTGNKSTGGNGGAIYASQNIRINATDFSVDDVDYSKSLTTFKSNSAVNGGAIYYGGNSAVLKNVSFTSNKASSHGGAIYLAPDSTANFINVSFEKNTGNYGGAVYLAPYSTLNIIAYQRDIVISGNTAKKAGGAFYADEGSTINVSAYAGNVTITGNKANGKSNAFYLGDYTALYLDTHQYYSKGILKRTLIKITDGIIGSDTVDHQAKNGVYKYGDGDFAITGKIANVAFHDESVNSGHILVDDYGNDLAWEMIHGVDMTLGNSTLVTANNKIGVLPIDNLNVKNDSANVMIDVDLKNAESDKIVANNSEGGVLNLSSVNLISNSKNPVSVKVGEGSEIKTMTATKAETAEATYKLKASLDANGNLVATAYGQKAKPCTMAAPVAAQLGGYLTQINSYDQAFMNMDMNMTRTLEERKAESLRNKFAYNGDSFGYDNGVNRNGKGLWTRPYATFERVGLSHGPKVGNIAYGNFFGGDADLKELNNGWKRQFSAYIGYNGSTQDFDRQSVDQNGGTIGVTEVWYKGNFFTGLTANAGANAVNASTDLGHENFPMLMAGIASKTGYNFEFFKGKFIVQPSILLSYSFVHTFSHKNGKGSHVGSSPLHAVQVAPGLKFIGNLPKGWQPYVGINMRWNIIDKTHFSLQDVSIPDMSIRPYVEYGVGLQRKWGERFTGFGQAMIRNGGRNGVMLSFGFKWALGK